MRSKTKKRNVKSSKKRRTKSKKMGGGLTPTRKGTLPTNNLKTAGLTQVALEYLQKSKETKKNPSPSSTPSSKKVDQYSSSLTSKEKAKILFNTQMKYKLETSLSKKIREAIQNRDLEISIKEALTSNDLTVDEIKEIINENVKIIIDHEKIKEYVNKGIIEIQKKLRTTHAGDM